MTESTPSATEALYHPESDVEDLEGYRPGDYHPTLIGNTFCDGHHQCLVGVSTGCSVASSKENSTNFMFPPDAARSLAAQLIMGLAYLHSNDVYHGDLHLHNFLLHTSSFNHLSTTELYEHHGKLYKVPVWQLDGKLTAPHAPLYTTYPMIWRMPVNEVADPEILISDYETFFIASQTPSPTLHTPALYALPEEFFNKPIMIPKAADIWTLGVVLYNAVGECPLFETFACDLDDIIAEMVNTLDDSSISNFQCISMPEFQHLHQHMWDMSQALGVRVYCEVGDASVGEAGGTEEHLD
ncbi:kinase domain containing [Coccidioides immitis RMSCC 2394]|uniref:non-specific serine/threonine protein kinase n=1 Tax=Coccidioides immitis RMSCC 2394 TaxID=404692 RepID=A0A0J6Y9K3_COCIT|nr:kinase domain containing [Coccidioides immitis RMSCC 2394]